MFIKKGDRINEKYSDVGIFLPNECNYWDQFRLLYLLKVALKRRSLKREHAILLSYGPSTNGGIYILGKCARAIYRNNITIFRSIAKDQKDHQTLGRLLIIGSTSYMVESLMFLITFSFGIEHSIVQMIFLI